VTITGNVGWNNTSGTAADPAATLALHNVNVTGALTVTDNAGAPTCFVSISGDEAGQGSTAIVGSIVSNTTVKLAEILLNNMRCTGVVNAGTSVDSAVILVTGGSVILGDVSCKSLACDSATIAGNVTVNAAEFALFRSTVFSSAITLTAITSAFDGSSWRSFMGSNCIRAVGTTVLVQGGYSAASVDGAALTGAATSVSLNGTGATAGFTGEHSGNHYSSASDTPTSVTLLTGGGETQGDTILISRTTLGTGVLAVINGGTGAGTIGTIPVNSRGFVHARFNGTDWVFVEGGSMLA